MTKTLGKFIKIKRIENDLSLSELSKEIGVSSSFFSGIERGKKSFPTRKGSVNYIEKIIKVLNLNEEEQEEFKQLVDNNLLVKQKIRGDIAEYLKSTPNAYKALCQAIKLNVSNKEWEKIINQLNTSE